LARGRGKRGKPPKQFKADLNKFAEQLDIDLATVLRRVGLEVFRGVVMLTPVDKGSARASWKIGVDSMPPSSVVNYKRAGSGSGKKAESRAQKQLPKLEKVKPFSKIIISNNQPYIFKLEYGGYPNPPRYGTYVKGRGFVRKTTSGFSQQAPTGMARITLQRVLRGIKKIMKEA
jgi:hypothetical protein